MKIKEIFKNSIERNIEPVVKVSDEDYEKVKQEVEEYVVTTALEQNYDQIFERIIDSKEKPTDRIGVWISGFFGSGKSLFLKNLSYVLSGRKIGSQSASEIFLTKLENSMTKANLSAINNSMKIKSILFEIKSQEDQMNRDSITEIMYRQFNKSFGFSEQVWIAEIEKELVDANKYEEFKNEIKKETATEWEDFRTKTLRLRPVLYKVLRKIYPTLYENEEKVKESIASFEKLSLTPEKFAEKVKSYIDKNLTSKEKLFFFVDEISMFIADSSSKLHELQAIVENVGEKCRGRVWVFVTAQEAIDNVIEGVKRKRDEFAKISDRFNTRVTLTSENIDKVVKERILKKKDSASKEIGDRYQKRAGKLNNDINFRDWARAQLIPKLDEESFVQTYPFLPYQLKVIPDIFNNIRSKGGGYSKLSGRERSMLGAVHSVFNDPKVNFKDKKIGEIVTFDMIYDEIAVELDGDTKKVINETERLDSNEGLFINRTLKCLFLMQQLPYIPRTVTNISMFLYEDMDSDFKKIKDRVESALAKLNEAQYVIKDHSGWKFLSPQEKKVEEEIQSIVIKPYEKQQSVRNVLVNIFDIPKINYKGLTVFDIKLTLDNETRSQKGEVELKVFSSINLQLEEKTPEQIVNESLDSPEIIYWLADNVSGLNDKVEKLERLRRVLDKKNQENRNGNLSDEEKGILLEKEKEKNNLEVDITQDIKRSFIQGAIIYEGKERKLDGRIQDIVAIFRDKAEEVIPKLYHQLSLADVKASEEDILDIFEKNLGTAAHAYKSLKILDEHNHVNVNAPVAQEVLKTIKSKINFGQSTTGKDLIEYFSKRPYGWNNVVLRMVLATLFRNGSIIAIYQQRNYQDYTEIGAKDIYRVVSTFKNTRFEEAGQSDLTPEQRNKCRGLVDEIFDERVADTPDSLSRTILSKTHELKVSLEKVTDIINSYSLPFSDEFSQIRKFSARMQEQAVSVKIIQIFLENADMLKKNVSKIDKIARFSTEDNLKKFKKIKHFSEDVLPKVDKPKAEEVSAILNSDKLVDEWSDICDQYEKLVEDYTAKYDKEIQERSNLFRDLLKELKSNELIKSLADSEKKLILESIEKKIVTERLEGSFFINGESLEQIRENIDAASSFREQTLRKAVELTKDKKQKEEASKIAYLSLNTIAGGVNVSNDKELQEVLEKVKTAIQKELKQGKKVILG